MKYLVYIVFFFVSAIIIYAGINHSTGMTNRTQKNGSGCICHNPQKDNNVSVIIEGPDTVIKGQTAQYKITLSGGPAVAGGFNIAASFGNLLPVDNSAQIFDGELTHTSPKLFSNGSVSWIFDFTALDQVYTDTIFSAANSVNNDGFATSQDKWNFGNKFIVNVIDQLSSLNEQPQLTNNFKLMQNYPNPFNPITKIRYTLYSKQFVTIKVFDITGNQVATLVNREQTSGEYEVEFSPGKDKSLSSGIYLYRLEAGGFSQTKKMVLQK